MLCWECVLSMCDRSRVCFVTVITAPQAGIFRTAGDGLSW